MSPHELLSCGDSRLDGIALGITRMTVGEAFLWGMWGSLSRENFEKLLEMDEDPKRVELARWEPGQRSSLR